MKNYVDKTINKLIDIAHKCIVVNNYEYSLGALSTAAMVLYGYNQVYTNKELESDLLLIKDNILTELSYKTKDNVILFYDGFGLDLRGWAASYVRSITKLGYHLIYACPVRMKDRIPHILGEMNTHSSTIIYFDDSSAYVERTKQIDSIFKKYTPGTAFFYTTPYDVSAAIAFSNNPSTTRIQVDLTDHAFWVGVNAFDYILESREMGASLAHYHRGIDKNKIIKCDCVPYINKDKSVNDLPIDIYHEKYIFTGGSLYKTLGDTELIYYKTIRHILDTFADIEFLYAGSGDTSEIAKLIEDYPGRVFLIDERPDFFEIIKHCLLYINSYPMFGGLMMRYAALASKVPITLKHGNDSDGILINQGELGIEFENYNEYIDEIDRLLSDDFYRDNKEKLLRNSVYDEDMFSNELDLIITDHKSNSMFEEINEFDTTLFRNEYKRRYKKDNIYKSLANRSSVWLIRYFPKEFLLGIILKLKEKCE